MSAPSSSKKTYTGSCHCGFIRYTVDLDLTDPKATKCNCSICHKTGFTSVRSTPEDFKLVSPASEDELAEYHFRTKTAHRYFCRTCGVQCFSRGSYEFEGQNVDFLAINAITIDQDQGCDVAKFKISYWDGKQDNWKAGPRDEPYPHGAY